MGKIVIGADLVLTESNLDLFWKITISWIKVIKG